MLINFPNGQFCGFASGPLFDKYFEGIFEIIPTPPLGTGWIPYFDEVGCYVPGYDYEVHATFPLKWAKLPNKWELMKKTQDMLKDNIIQKIHQSMDRLVGTRCRMGGYLDMALMWIPEDALEFHVELDARNRCLALAMTARIGLIVI